jgi:hypothetical protein
MEFATKVKGKYAWLTMEDAISIANKAKMFYYGYAFPCEPYLTEEERPIDSFFAKTWVLAACDELVERLGFNSSVGYRENGVTWTFDGAELSDRLVGLIKPTIGVLK